VSTLGPLPRLHPRELITREAEREFSLALETVITKHKLTAGEAFRVVNTIFSSFVNNVVRGAIRVERHGDHDKPGAWE
jgi:hypothetical protein